MTAFPANSSMSHLNRIGASLLLMASFLTLTCVGRGAENNPAFRYQNPLGFRYESQGRTETELRDPCIIREGDTYYVAFTMWPFRGRDAAHLADADNGSSPGIALYSSKDLQQWTFCNWLLESSKLPADCPYKHRFWAPEIHKFKDKFYLIFTADNWLKNEYNPAGHWASAGWAFVGVADRVTGPYEHVTWIEGAGCDTTLFEDTDGKTYAFIPRGNVDVQEIDLTGIYQDKVKLLGKPQRIVSPDNADIGLSTQADYLEGPWATKVGSRYYLFFAAYYSEKKNPHGGAGYFTGVAYADNVLGPWKKDPRSNVFEGGHLAVFEGPDGKPWFSYRGEHANKARGQLCIDPVNLDENGAVASPGPSVGEQSIPLPGKAITGR